MASTLQRMDRDGLLSKRASPEDRRSTLYRLSEKGLAMMDQVRAAGHEVNALALSGMDEAEQTAYLALLAKAVGNLERDEPDD